MVTVGYMSSPGLAIAGDTIAQSYEHYTDNLDDESDQVDETEGYVCLQPMWLTQDMTPTPSLRRCYCLEDQHGLMSCPSTY